MKICQKLSTSQKRWLQKVPLYACVLFDFMVTNLSYYMASSASGQDEPNRALWLAAGACHLARSGTTRCIPRAKFPQKPYNKSFIDQVCSVNMAGYWPRSFFASLSISTSSRSINTQKKNLANIQPSWPHTSSITHTYCTLSANYKVPCMKYFEIALNASLLPTGIQ